MKQKIVLGVLAVLILGAGSIWYMFRDSGSQKVEREQTGERTQRRQRTVEVAEKKERQKRDTAVEAVETRERRERETVAEERGTRKTRERVQAKVKKKKKKLAPAA